MRNVMIVDDESLVRVGLQSIIDWESRGYTIAGVYRNGEEALQAATERKFDVILTDIKMPVMDGFELIRQLKARRVPAHIVVLSSYNEFAYTRQAIQLGVADYISKYQLEPEELIRVLDGLQGAGGEPEAAAMPDPERELRDQKEELLRLTQPSANEREPDAPALRSKLAERGDAACWVTIKPYPREPMYLSSERKALQALTEEIFARLRATEFIGADGDMMHGLIVFPGDEPAEARDQTIATATSELLATIAQKVNIALVIGVSAPSGDWRPAHMRSGALLATERSFGGGPGVYRDDDPGAAGKRLRTFGESEWVDFYKLVKQHIQLERFAELTDWFAQLAAAEGANVKPAEWLRLADIVATHLTDFIIDRYHLHPDKIERHFGDMWPLPDYAKRANRLAVLTEHVAAMIRRTQEMIVLMHANQGWIRKVKDYVERHYAEPIRLEDVAALVSFNENYFSQRFRQETGEGFSDYLTHYRIRQAMILFEETDLSTEQIAGKVGYANPNYFVKVFKKVAGRTVSEFKRRF